MGLVCRVGDIDVLQLICASKTSRRYDCADPSKLKDSGVREPPQYIKEAGRNYNGLVRPLALALNDYFFDFLIPSIISFFLLSCGPIFDFIFIFYMLVVTAIRG